MQVPTAELLDPGELGDLDRAELGEVDLGHGGQGEGQGSAGPGRGTLRECLLHEALDVVFEHPTFRPRPFDECQVDAELASETSDGGTRMGLTALGDRGHVLGARQHRSGTALGFAGRAFGTGCRTRRSFELFSGVCSHRRGSCDWLAAADLAFGAQCQDEIALIQGIPRLDGQLLDDPRVGRGDLHGRLVALEREERLVDLDAIPRSNQDLDHRDIREIADIGQDDGDGFATARRTRRG